MSVNQALKIIYNGDIRRARLKDLTYSSLKALVDKLFGREAVEGTKFRYADEDGDMVLICSDEEVQDAFAFAKESGKTLRIQIKPSKAKKRDPKPAADAKAPTPKAANVPSKATGAKTPPKSVPSESAFEEWMNHKDAKRAERKKVQEAKRAYRQAKREERQKNPEENCRWKCGGGKWREWRRENRQKRKEAKCELLKEIESFLADEKVITALQESLPVIADKLLKEEDLKGILESILETQPVLKNNKLVQRLRPLVEAFLPWIPMGIAGPILLDIILELQAMLHDGKIDIPIRRFCKRIMRIVKQGFNGCAPEVHHGVYCDKCGCDVPLTGPRWKKIDENYDLCQKHYDELDENEKKNFKKVERHGWQPPCAFGIPGFHPGAFAFMNPFGAAFGGAFGGSPGFGPQPFGRPNGPFGRRGGTGRHSPPRGHHPGFRGYPQHPQHHRRGFRARAGEWGGAGGAPAQQQNRRQRQRQQSPPKQNDADGWEKASD